jgi:hypothetical protein
VPGDLYIAGECLSDGYAEAPAPDRRAVPADPFAAGRAAARAAASTAPATAPATAPDGNLEFLGRLDTQVKVRGFRIELGEIEAVLASTRRSPRRWCWRARTRRAISGWSPTCEPDAAAPPDADELRRWPRRELPEYMVPAAWVTVESWPLSPTGKLDRQALPAPEPARARPPARSGCPRGAALERPGARVWGEVLGSSRVDPEATFFDLGGPRCRSPGPRAPGGGARPADPMVELFRFPTIGAWPEP